MKRMRIATTLLLLALLAPAAALTAQGGPARPETPAAAPPGMQLTTKGFRLPVVVREWQQVQGVDFGYR